MPVCVCVKRGQVRRDDGFVRFYEEGEKDTFKECPILFRPLSAIIEENVDISTVSEDLLRDEDVFPLEKLVAFYKQRYGESLEGESRLRVVDKILYARHNPMVALSERGQAPLAHELAGFTTPEPKTEVSFSETESDIPAPPPVADTDANPAEKDGMESGLDDLLK